MKKEDLAQLTETLASLTKAIEANTELVAKYGFQLQHMDTLLSNVHSRMGLVENQLAFNKEALAALAKTQVQAKATEPEVTLTLPLSQAQALLQGPPSSVSAYLGDGIIDKDTAILLKNPKDPTVLSAQEKHAALTAYSPENPTGGKIGAIKLLRARTGLGLKEAKDKVEEWLAAHSVGVAA